MNETQTRHDFRIMDHDRNYLYDVEATTVEEAAQIACKKMNGGRKVHSRRLTGDRGLSGWFLAYRDIRTAGHLESSTGKRFHVSER